MIQDFVYVVTFESSDQPGKALYIGEDVPVTDFLPAAKKFRSPEIAYKNMNFHKRHHKLAHDHAVFKVRRKFELVDEIVKDEKGQYRHRA